MEQSEKDNIKTTKKNKKRMGRTTNGKTGKERKIFFFGKVKGAKGNEK